MTPNNERTNSKNTNPPPPRKSAATNKRALEITSCQTTQPKRLGERELPRRGSRPELPRPPSVRRGELGRRHTARQQSPGLDLLLLLVVAAQVAVSASATAAGAAAAAPADPQAERQSRAVPQQSRLLWLRQTQRPRPFQAANRLVALEPVAPTAAATATAGTLEKPTQLGQLVR